MPIKKSAIKRAKQDIVIRTRNRALKKAFRLNIKEITKKLSSEKAKDAVDMIPDTYKSLDKAAKNGAIHKNNAARRKSRLMKKINETLNKPEPKLEKPKEKKLDSIEKSDKPIKKKPTTRKKK